MNSKTAKLINRYAAASSLKPKFVKRWWRKTPWNKRNQLRKHMQDEIS